MVLMYVQLDMAITFSTMVVDWVRQLNDVEVSGNRYALYGMAKACADSPSLERILHYVQAEQEPPHTKAGEPPAAWPSSGSIHVEKLCARFDMFV